jgi:hypothetical protein
MVGQGACPLACPYFIPALPHPLELWPHRHRLPLGDGFAGSCGARPADVCCDDETLRLHCNLGYADMGGAQGGEAGCAHLPAERTFDAVRFQIRSSDPESADRAILGVRFACERGHRPALCGELRYDRVAMGWIDPPEPRMLPLAEAAVRAWITRNGTALGGSAKL